MSSYPKTFTPGSFSFIHFSIKGKNEGVSKRLTMIKKIHPKQALGLLLLVFIFTSLWFFRSKNALWFLIFTSRHEP
jgi:hypothetical protein